MLAFLLALAAGCTARDPQAPTPSLFPLDQGLRWTYRVTTQTPRGTTVDRLDVENRGPTRWTDGPPAPERRNSLGNSYWFRVDTEGIYRVAVRTEIERTPRSDADGLRRFVLKEPVRVGTGWSAMTWPYLLRRTIEWPSELRLGAPVEMRFRIEDTDASVEVPAGRFERCVLVSGRHVMRLFVDPVVNWADVPLEQREWYCPGVGLTKLVRTEQVRSQFYSGGEVRYELERGPR